MENYCVYRHIRLDSNTPFYVGKGKDNRPFIKSKRNEYWKNIVNKAGYEVEIIAYNLTEEEAFEKEIEFIKLYKALGYCEANLTDGGEGVSGYRWTEEHKAKMKELHQSPEHRKKMRDIHKNRIYKLNEGSFKENHRPWNKGIKKSTNCKKAWETRRKNGTDISPNKGKTNSRDQIIKYALSRKCKPFKVIHIETNKIMWEGLLQTECIEFLKEYKLNKGNLNMCLKGIRKSHKGFKFEYL